MTLRVVLSAAGLALAGTVAAGFVDLSSSPVSSPAPALPVESPAGAACPLTVPRQIEAVMKFEEMMPVLRHPRCINCHGGVNPFVPYERGGHLGGEMPPEQKCGDCHDQLTGGAMMVAGIALVYSSAAR